MPETANEQITTPHFARQTTTLNLNVDTSELEREFENDDFHSEDKVDDFHSENEVDISKVDSALDHQEGSDIHLDNVEMVEKDTPQSGFIEKDVFQCRYI